MNRFRQISMLLAIASCLGMQAEVKMPAFFSSGMVMQRNADCKLWGTAEKNKTVKVSASWSKESYKTQVSDDGKWQLTIKTPDAGGPYELTVSDGKELKIDNVMVGELWLCSGQSNMEMPMKGYKNQPVEGASDAILHSKNPNIRLFTVKRCASITPVDDVTGQWSEAAPKSVREFSATAYYFGRLLNEILDIPVGLIVTAWGGSACEAWNAPEWLTAFPQVKLPQTQEEVNKTEQRCPTALYNGMLHPLIGINIAGVIWYQGEDNWPRYSYYADLFSGMVKGWRQQWAIGEFPFYYCQIAPYDYDLITFEGQDTVCSAYLREQQWKAELMIPNSGMAVLMDAGLEKGIHPMKKQVAGERLARLALVKTYGIEGITAESPRFSGMKIQNDTIICSFDNDKMWINCHGKYTSDLFEVAGEDRVFHKAKAWVSRSKMMVKSDEVKKPVAVRYAFKNFVEGDVFCEDLPLSSFRSDEW